MKDMTPVYVGVAIAVFLFGLIFFAFWWDGRQARQCVAVGGHIVSKNTVGWSGPNMVVGGVSFCVSADGRILY